MKSVARVRCLLTVAFVLLAVAPEPVLACAVCFGKSDSALARGMNMGIFSMLGMITFVLMAVAGFFIFLSRKSAKINGVDGGGSASGAVAAELHETTTRS